MATGLVLACSLAKWCIGRKVSGVTRTIIYFSNIVAIGLVLRGLWHSYSRGAVLGAICGLGYLLMSILNWHFLVSNRRKRSNTFFFALVVVSLCFLAFWSFCKTGWPPARRAFSIVKTIDFSWRNRVAAWNGALQITTEYPCFGAGWNQSKPLYEHYYLSPKLSESVAIEMNDYLVLGATLGIPALFCFCMYIWLSLTKAESRKLKAESSEAKSISRKQIAEISEADWLRATCRAGAVVLLVGFWFDGGLFKLPTAATFWILLELGRREEILTADITDNSDKKLLAEKYAQ